mgnify:CR=1 FL=1|jgi:hypothetical protein
MVRASEKARHVATRGSKGISCKPLPMMLPCGPEYLIAHACFQCRKSWKVRGDTSAICPQCAAPLHEMGRAFAAPKKTDVEQWRKVEALWRHGYRFWSVGSTEVEPLPTRLKDVDDFVRRNPGHPARLVR